MLVVSHCRSSLSKPSMSAPGSSLPKTAAVIVLLLVAGWMSYRSFFSKEGGGDLAFFYDLSEQEIFTAPRTSIPPIQGLNDEELDAVRAVVISTNGEPRNKSTWRVAYLEIYSPELKEQMEQAQLRGSSPTIGRAQAQAHRLVRRVDGDEWYPMNSAEAEAVISTWLTAGPDGGAATICTP